MNSRYLLASAATNSIEKLFAAGEGGRLSFGVAGETKEPATVADLLAGEVLFRAYVMEGFVTYYLAASSSPDGLLLSVRAVDSPRSAHIGWLIQQQAESEGFNVQDCAL